MIFARAAMGQYRFTPLLYQTKHKSTVPIVQSSITYLHTILAKTIGRLYNQIGGGFMFELYQLQQLLVVAGCGTLSGAAEQLHLSQPALSRSMQRLEREVQVPLFVRRKNRIDFRCFLHAGMY